MIKRIVQTFWLNYSVNDETPSVTISEDYLQLCYHGNQQDVIMTEADD